MILVLGLWQSLIWAEDHNGQSFGGGGIAGGEDDNGRPPPCDDDNGAIDDNDNDDCDDDNNGGGGQSQRKGNFDFENCPPFKPDEGHTRVWFVDEDIKQEKDNEIKLPLVLGDGHFEGSGSSPAFRVRAGVDVHYMPFECLNDRGIGDRWRYWRDLMGNIQLKSIDGSGDPKVADWWAHTNFFNDDGGFYYQEGEKIRDWVGIDYGCRKEMHWGGGGADFSALPSKVGFCKYEVGFDPDPPPQGSCLDGQASPNQPIIDVEVSQVRLIDEQGFISGGFSAPLVFVDQDDNGFNDLKDEYYEFKVEVTPPGPGYDLGSFTVGRSDSGPDEESYVEITIDDQKVSFGSEIGAKESQSVKIKALYSKEEGEQADPGFFLYYNPVDPVEYFGEGSRYGDPGDPHSPPYFSRLWVSTRISDVMILPHPVGAVRLPSDMHEQALPDQELRLSMVEWGYQNLAYYEPLGQEMEIECALIGDESGQARLDYDTIYSDEDGFAFNRLEMPGQVDQSLHRSTYRTEAKFNNLVYQARKHGTDVLLTYQLKEPIVIEYGEVTVLPGKVASIEIQADKEAIPAVPTAEVTLTGKFRDIYGNLTQSLFVPSLNFKGEPDWLEEYDHNQDAQVPTFESNEDGEFSLSYKSDAFPSVDTEDLEVTIAAGDAEETMSIEQLPVVLTLDIDKDTLVMSEDSLDFATCHVEVKDSQGDPVPDGTPVKILISHGRLETLAGEWIGPEDELVTQDGKLSFLLKGSHARHDPDDGILLIVTCASRSEKSYVKTRVKVDWSSHAEDGVILSLKGRALLAGDHSEDTTRPSNYAAEHYKIDIPIPATTEVEVLGPPGALVEIAHAASSSVLCYSCDVIAGGQKVPDECHSHHADSFGAESIDEALFFDGAAWLETPHHPRLDLQEFSLRMLVKPEEHRGSLVEKAGEYHLHINAEGFLVWEVITDTGSQQVLSTEAVKLELWNQVEVSVQDGEIEVSLNGVESSLEISGQIQSQGQDLIWAGQAYRGALDDIALSSVGIQGGDDSAYGLVIGGLQGDSTIRLNDQGIGQLSVRSNGSMAGMPDQSASLSLLAARIVEEGEYGSEDDDDDDGGMWSWVKNVVTDHIKEHMPPEVVIIGKVTEKGVQELAEIAHEKAEVENHAREDGFDPELFVEMNLGERVLYFYDYVHSGPGMAELTLELSGAQPFITLFWELLKIPPSEIEPTGMDPDMFVVAAQVAEIIVMLALSPKARAAAKTVKGLKLFLRGFKGPSKSVLQRRAFKWFVEIIHSAFKEPDKINDVIFSRLTLFDNMLTWHPKEVDQYTAMLKSTDDWAAAAHLSNNLGDETFDWFVRRLTDAGFDNIARSMHHLLAKQVDDDFIDALKKMPNHQLGEVYQNIRKILESVADSRDYKLLWTNLGRAISISQKTKGVDTSEFLKLTAEAMDLGLKKDDNLYKLLLRDAEQWAKHGPTLMRGLRYVTRWKKDFDEFSMYGDVPSFTVKTGSCAAADIYSIRPLENLDYLKSLEIWPGSLEGFAQKISQDARRPYLNRWSLDEYVVGADLYEPLKDEIKELRMLDDLKKKLLRSIERGGDPG